MLCSCTSYCFNFSFFQMLDLKELNVKSEEEKSYNRKILIEL